MKQELGQLESELRNLQGGTLPGRHKAKTLLHGERKKFI